MKKCVLTPDFEKRDTAPVMHRSRKALRRQRKVVDLVKLSFYSNHLVFSI